MGRKEEKRKVNRIAQLNIRERIKCSIVNSKK